MNKFSRPILLSLLLLMALPAGADSSTDAIQHQIESVLAQRHPTDTPEWWRSLGPPAPAVIISMYQNTSHIYHRLRLLGALAWFDDPVAVDFLKKQAESSGDDVVVSAAIKSVGISQGAKE